VKNAKCPNETKVWLYTRTGIEAFEQDVVRTYYFQNKTQNYVCNGRKGEFSERATAQESYDRRKTFTEMIAIFKRKNELNEGEFQSMIHEAIKLFRS
jgi:hypothetical protein